MNTCVIVAIIIVGLILCQSVASYQINVQNVQRFDPKQMDDGISLVAAAPVSPILNSSIVYNFLATVATLKGKRDVAQLMMMQKISPDGELITVDDITESLTQIDVDELLTMLTSIKHTKPNVPDGSGKIDCTKCAWGDRGMCKMEGTNIDCSPGICQNIGDADPWAAESPWKPSEALDDAWDCKGGRVLTNNTYPPSYNDYVQKI